MMGNRFIGRAGRSYIPLLGDIGGIVADGERVYDSARSIGR
jgi:hypothetical protein